MLFVLTFQRIMFIECYISLREESSMRNMVNHLASRTTLHVKKLAVVGFGGAAFVHEVVDKEIEEEDVQSGSGLSCVAMYKHKDSDGVASSSANGII